MNDYPQPERGDPPDPPPSEGAGERLAFAVHRDPSLTNTAVDPASRVGRGIAWVRSTDLIASSTARIAGRGINLQAELAHRARRAPGQAYRATCNGVRDIRDHRAQRTTPDEESVFDVFEPQNRNRSSSWVRPSGIGLG